ncbi:MAG TPA: hypothetical protein VFS90_04560 [Pyrinomonadaceae bacterium]|nr:hypothetical protein [Pyrinomonadaceae bacterium]
MQRIRLALSLAILLAVVVLGYPATRSRAAVKCTCFIPQIEFYGVWIDTNACGGECDRPGGNGD